MGSDAGERGGLPEPDDDLQSEAGEPIAETVGALDPVRRWLGREIEREDAATSSEASEGRSTRRAAHRASACTEGMPGATPLRAARALQHSTIDCRCESSTRATGKSRPARRFSAWSRKSRHQITA